MVSFMCHLDWAVVPRYLVKHYSQCIYKHFLMKLAFELMS